MTFLAHNRLIEFEDHRWHCENEIMIARSVLGFAGPVVEKSNDIFTWESAATKQQLISSKTHCYGKLK